VLSKSFSGSTDAQVWFDLRIHVDDQSLSAPGQIAAWPVHGKNACKPYRYFRVIQTTDNTNILSLCAVELYGYFQ
jgi:hypothetical protein